MPRHYDERYEQGRSRRDLRAHGREDDEGGYRRRGSQMARTERSRGARHDEEGSTADTGQGGWFGDSEGHSDAARRGWERSDHRPSGWFGDSEGHSEASRRGWERSDHRPSGWFGDPEGHSRAARRGWGESDYERGKTEEEGRSYSPREPRHDKED